MTASTVLLLLLVLTLTPISAATLWVRFNPLIVDVLLSASLVVLLALEIAIGLAALVWMQGCMG